MKNRYINGKLQTITEENKNHLKERFKIKQTSRNTENRIKELEKTIESLLAKQNEPEE